MDIINSDRINDFTKIEENIFVVKNFLTQEECKRYYNFAETIDENDWWIDNNVGWYQGKYVFLGNYEISRFGNEIIERLKGYFDLNKVEFFGGLSGIHRIKPEENMYIHADYAEIDSMPEEIKSKIVLTNLVVYFNTVEGGNVFYPELNIEYHPEAGDLLIHPGITKYRHGVKEVKGNQARYASAFWLSNTVGENFKKSGYMLTDEKYVAVQSTLPMEEWESSSSLYKS